MDGSIGVIYGLLAMIALGLSNALSKSPILKEGNRVTVFYRGVAASIVLGLLLFIFRKSIIISWTYIVMMALVGFVGYVALISLFHAFRVGKVGAVMPIANASVVITVLLALLFYNETLAALQFAGLGLIVLGVVLISIDFKDIRRSSIFDAKTGIQTALLVCLLWGAMFFLFKIPVLALGAILAGFLLEFSIFLYSGIHLLAAGRSLRLASARAVMPMLVIGILTGIATGLISLGTETAGISFIMGLVAAAPLVVALYGRIVYRERLTNIQWISALIIVAGIVMMSIA
jgi:transporter family protein